MAAGAAAAPTDPELADAVHVLTSSTALYAPTLTGLRPHPRLLIAIASLAQGFLSSANSLGRRSPRMAGGAPTLISSTPQWKALQDHVDVVKQT
jgi:hypothetical protein